MEMKVGRRKETQFLLVSGFDYPVPQISKISTSVKTDDGVLRISYV